MKSGPRPTAARDLRRSSRIAYVSAAVHYTRRILAGNQHTRREPAFYGRVEPRSLFERPIGTRVFSLAGVLTMELGSISTPSLSTVAIIAPIRSNPAYMVKFCLNRAAECRRGAERATDTSRKQSWLKTEGQWFFLARSYDNEGRAHVFLWASVKPRHKPREFDQPPLGETEKVEACYM
jgi:hypothetical protein